MCSPLSGLNVLSHQLANKPGFSNTAASIALSGFYEAREKMFYENLINESRQLLKLHLFFFKPTSLSSFLCLFLTTLLGHNHLNVLWFATLAVAASVSPRWLVSFRCFNSSSVISLDFLHDI